MRDLLLEYFQSFDQKDTIKLKKLLSSNVALTDWENAIVGRKNVLHFTSQMFLAFPLLKIEIKELFFAKNSACAEITVHLDNEKSLDVVDVFDVEVDKILRIKAYRK